MDQRSHRRRGRRGSRTGVIVDMTRHLRRWLNDKALSENFDDRYEGRVADVTEEMIRNKFTGANVVTFEDGWRLLPNVNSAAPSSSCSGKRRTTGRATGSSSIGTASRGPIRRPGS